MDLVFLVDGSMSVRQEPFLKGLEFINKIVDHVSISKDHGRIGFIQFSHQVCAEFSIEQYKTSFLSFGLLFHPSFRPSFLPSVCDCFDNSGLLRVTSVLYVDRKKSATPLVRDVFLSTQLPIALNRWF